MEVKGKSFAPDASAGALLDKAARTATRMGHVMAYTPSPLLKDQLWYPDRHYIVQNADGTFDFYFGPKSPGEAKNWLATLPGKGFFAIFRLYGPKQAFFDQTWKINDIEKVQ